MAKPNYLSTMKKFALQQPSEDWMILEFSQLGFIGVPYPHPMDLNRAFQSHPALLLCHQFPLTPCSIMLGALPGVATAAPPGLSPPTIPITVCPLVPTSACSQP